MKWDKCPTDRIIQVRPIGITWEQVTTTHTFAISNSKYDQDQQRIRELKEALAQSQAMTQRLQERIRELEREAAELRARVARLTGSE